MTPRTWTLDKGTKYMANDTNDMEKDTKDMEKDTKDMEIGEGY